ncbi:MAG: phytanoyl-CoA dioxygenase family protein [Ginsengibacter sp.]
MLSIIRRLKIAYSFYNFFHKKELIQNEILYKKWGIRKKYFSSVSSKDFRNVFLKKENELTAESDFSSDKLFNQLNRINQENVRSFAINGYAKISNYLSEEQVDSVNEEIGRLVHQRILKFNDQNKLMFAIHHSSLINDIGNDENLKKLLARMMNGTPILFQSINFFTGSEQDTHSDSIHMTTFPLGGLLGLWIALEDITTENGPLHYYPKSHLLPYYLNADYQNEGSFFFLGKKSYKAYENMIAEKIKEHGLQKEIFTAKKGDMFIWHANLFHGGEPHKNKSLSRKSMVYHYFREGSVCYHEITQRPALIKNYL